MELDRNVVRGLGEEIFWRGYVQRRMTATLDNGGLALSILTYTTIHLTTNNLTLILATLMYNAFWVALYRQYDSIWINAVSHGVWAAAIFVWFPVA